MFFHHHNNEDGPPCQFMETYLNQAADGSAKGFKRWYAFAHAARCLRCAKFLRGLQETIGKLGHAHEQELPPELMDRLTQEMNRASEAAAESL